MQLTAPRDLFANGLLDPLEDGPRSETAPAANETKETRDGAVATTEVGCLVAAAGIAAETDLSLSERLDRIAAALAEAREGAPRRSCRIELDDAVHWSPAYAEAAVRVTHLLEMDGATIGLITIGYPDLAEEAAPPPGEPGLAEGAATLISQMLALHAASEGLLERQLSLQTARTMLAQSERFASIRFWEFDPQTSVFTWVKHGERTPDTGPRGPLSSRLERRVAASLSEAAQETAKTHKAFVREIPYALSDGTERLLRAEGELGPRHETQHDHGQQKVVGAIRDVTDEKLGRAEFLRTDDRDLLTGLPNRRALYGRLDETLVKRGASGMLVMFDLDRFTEVNNLYGHAFGDAMLRAFARRVAGKAQTNFVARTSSNEFALILEGMDRARAEGTALAFLASLREPLEVFARSVPISLSAGLAMYPADGRDTTELVKNAALVINTAKEHGPNTILAFTPEIRDRATRRIELRAEVRQGLRDGQFVPYYQPKVCLRSGALCGFEALARWHHPSGVRQPKDFLGALSDLELARELFVRLFDKCIADLSAWRKQGLPLNRVSLNTSASEFYKFDLAHHVLSRLEEAQLPTSALGIEVTETVILGINDPPIELTLRRLRDAGVEIALDDFGTGYASLTHLRTYPIDTVKIDRSFVDRLAQDPASQAIVSAVLGLGRTLGLTVVAEGVETRDQMNMLVAGACDQAQGFLFARPMPAAEVPAFEAAWSSALTRKAS